MSYEELSSKRINSLEDAVEGTLYSAIIDEFPIPEVRVHTEGGKVFLCQNKVRGHTPNDTLGYNYGWSVGNGSSRLLRSEGVMIFPYGTDLSDYTEYKKRFMEEDRIRREEERKAREEMERKAALKRIDDNKKYFVKRVLNYVKSNNSSPLKFKKDGLYYDINDNEHVNFMFSFPDITAGYKDYLSTLSGVDSLVFKAIIFSRFCSSSSDIRGIETGSSCRRSSIDIWRHIISTNPEITIFQVMESMYKLGDSQDITLGSNFCSWINRQVFYFAGTKSSKFGLEHKDECGNYFINWSHCTELYDVYKEKHETTESGPVQ